MNEKQVVDEELELEELKRLYAQTKFQLEQKIELLELQLSNIKNRLWQRQCRDKVIMELCESAEIMPFTSMQAKGIFALIREYAKQTSRGLHFNEFPAPPIEILDELPF